MSNPTPSFGDRAIDIVAEDKLRRAMQEGQFDRLPGLGKPHPVFDDPLDADWWLKRKLRDEGLGPSGPGPDRSAGG